MDDATPTGRCLINVTPDGQRTMSTSLGAAALLSAEDVDPAVIEAAKIIYLEGYLFDPEPARRAFAKAAGLARASDRLIALTLSDSFVIDRHRPTLLGFIAGEVDILFANEAEITSLFELAMLRRRHPGGPARARQDRGGHPRRPGLGDRRRRGDSPDRSLPRRESRGHDRRGRPIRGGISVRPRPGPLAGAIAGVPGSLAAAEVIAHYGPRPQVPLALTWPPRPDCEGVRQMGAQAVTHRTAEVVRETKETQIRVSVDLGRERPCRRSRPGSASTTTCWTALPCTAAST